MRSEPHPVLRVLSPHPYGRLRTAGLTQRSIHHCAQPERLHNHSNCSSAAACDPSTEVAYGELSAATDLMTTRVFIGDREWALDGIWRRLTHGWRLDTRLTYGR
jgi:hypothetical protein